MYAKRVEESSKRLFTATIAGSLAWHLIALVLFSTVFGISLKPEHDIPVVRPVVIKQYGCGSGFYLEKSAENILESLKINLPPKRAVEKTAPLADKRDLPELVADIGNIAPDRGKTDGLGVYRDVGSIGRGLGIDKVEDVSISGPGIDIEVSGRRLIFLPPPPKYPSDCEKRGIEGDTVLSFVVSPDGDVTATKVICLSGSTLLDQAALEYIRKFKFSHSEKSTPGRVTIRFRFRKMGEK